MVSEENNWKFGEVVTLPRTTKTIKNGVTSYGMLHISRYVCVREATDTERGVLVKVLGRFPREHIKIVDGKPFCTDDHDDLFESNSYLTFPFPTTTEVQEVLDIINSHPEIMDSFREASMHINLQAKFWVSETEKHLLIMKKPLCYDAKYEQVEAPAYNDSPYRITLAYFYKGELLW